MCKDFLIIFLNNFVLSLLSQCNIFWKGILIIPEEIELQIQGKIHYIYLVGNSEDL